jgi:MFS superfamily sulfate permease-like transporter
LYDLFFYIRKYSKKDFFTMIVTITFTFVFDTSIGLAVGIATSIVVYCVFDIIFAKSHDPRLFHSSREGGEVDVVRIESDLNFLTSARVKDFIAALVLEAPSRLAVTNKSELYRFHVSSVFDKVFKPNLLAGVQELPKAIVVDLCIVKTVDLSGLEAMAGVSKEVRSKGVRIAFINAAPDIADKLESFGIKSDTSTAAVNFEEYEIAYRLDLWSIQDKQLRHQSSRVRAISGEHVSGEERSFVEVEMVNVGDSPDVSYHFDTVSNPPRKTSQDLGAERGADADPEERQHFLPLVQIETASLGAANETKLD